MKSIRLIVLFLLLPPVLQAQNGGIVEKDVGVVSGQVFDAETSSPLEFVNVYLDGTHIGTTTVNGGKFKMRSIPAGTYRLIIQHIGYEKYIEEHLPIGPGKSITRSIGLRPTEVQGQEVVITATQKELTAQMAPASVLILRAKDLNTRPADTFDQALENSPGISVYRSAGISVQSMSIRGSSDVAGGGVGNRVLLMIDGRPALTPDAGGAFWSLVPTNFIDRVEVVKGAFSSLYGSTAMGGVINVITRRPTYRAITKINLGYGLFEKAPPSIRYTEKTPIRRKMEISHSGVRGRLSYLFNASRKESDGHAEATGYEFYDVFGKFMYDLCHNRNLELTVGGGFAKNDYPHSWLNNIQPLQVRAKYQDDRQEKKHASVDLHYWAVPGKNTKYDSRFYYYRNASSSFFNENDPQRTLPGNEPFGMTTDINGQKYGSKTQLDHHLSDKHYIITGLDFQIDNVRSSPDTIMYGNHQINNGAFYLQDEIQFHAKWIATLGLRYDWNHLVGGRTFSLVSPKFAMVYLPRQDLAFRLLFGQAFRAPTIAESFFQKEIAGGTLFKPNPELRAERMNFSLETGLRWQIGSFIDIDAAFFRYHYKDMIYWIDISAEEGVDFPYFQVRNLNEALMQGGGFSVGFRWNRSFRGSISYTYVDAQNQSSNRKNDFLAYRPKHSLVFSTEFNRDPFTINLSGRYRSDIETVFLYPREKPDAFLVTNAKILARLNENLGVSAAVGNIFDVEYEELARYRSPGRNWMFGATVQF
jgi:outer membrane receptor for ferrienterochelin and colicin